MQLEAVTVKLYRNFVDEQRIKVESDVTCLVGKNESGKTTILKALHRLKPANGDDTAFDLTTAKNHNEGSRNRLVDTMIELSDFDAITTPKQLLYYEIDAALGARFGRPADTAAPRVFGRGIAHLTAGGVHYSTKPTNGRVASEDKSSDLRTPIDRQREELLLRAGPSSHARVGLPLDLVNWGDLFVQHEASVPKDALINVGVCRVG